MPPSSASPLSPQNVQWHSQVHQTVAQLSQLRCLKKTQAFLTLLHICVHHLSCAVAPPVPGLCHLGSPVTATAPRTHSSQDCSWHHKLWSAGNSHHRAVFFRVLLKDSWVPQIDSPLRSDLTPQPYSALSSSLCTKPRHIQHSGQPTAGHLPVHVPANEARKSLGSCPTPHCTLKCRLPAV